MEKLVYQYDKNFGYWTISQFISYPKSEMILLKMSLDEQYYWIKVDNQKEEIIIWDSCDEEDISFENIPKLKLSKTNYAQIIDQWNRNIANPTKYLILSRNNLGWITLELKNELSAEDLAAIEEDKQN